MRHKWNKAGPSHSNSQSSGMQQNAALQLMLGTETTYSSDAGVSCSKECVCVCYKERERELIRKGFKWLSADRHNLSPSSTLICCHLHLLLLLYQHTAFFNYDGLIRFLLRSLQTVRGHPIHLLADNYLEKIKSLRRRDTLSYLWIDVLIKRVIIHEEVWYIKDFNTWHKGKEPPDVMCPWWRISTNPSMHPQGGLSVLQRGHSQRFFAIYFIVFFSCSHMVCWNCAQAYVHWSVLRREPNKHMILRLILRKLKIW